MKKLLTFAFIISFTFAGQSAFADDHGNNGRGKGKAKGKPAFVDEKHRAHANWKQEKEYQKEYKKRSKKHNECDDHDDRWERNREEQRRRDSNRRTNNRSLGQVILDGINGGQNQRN